MGNNSSDESVVSSDDSIASSVASSGDGSVSDHGVGGVGSDGGDMGNSGDNVGLLSVDGDMDSLVDGGGVRGDHSLGRVHVVGGVVDVGGLNNFLDSDLGDDVGLLGSDPGVGPHGSEDLLLDHGVSGSGSLVSGSGRDGRPTSSPRSMSRTTMSMSP